MTQTTAVPRSGDSQAVSPLAAEARARLAPDPVFNADLLDIVQRGAGDILAADDRGVLLRDDGSGAYLMTATSPAAVDSLLDLVIDPPHLVTHQDYSRPLIAARFGFDRATACYQSAFLGPTLPAIERPDLRVEALGADWAAQLAQQYSLGLGVDYLRQRCAAGAMYGAFPADAATSPATLAGFIGQHAEGSMGLLEIYPAHRRQGIGQYLVTWLANLILAEGRVPFDQIIVGNQASEALQRHLGFTISTKRLYWMSADRAA